ncbi:MAG: DUF2853 family protein [Litorimonas sp.]
MLDNGIAWIICWLIIPLLLMGLLGLLLGMLFFRGKKTVGDLSVEGEGALRAEADSLRARVQELEGRVSTRDTEVTGLKAKLAAAAAGAAAATAAAAVATKSAPETTQAEGDDESYALEWRNRYLAARVKYLEGRLADAPKAKAVPVVKKAATKKKPVAKKAKPKAKAASAPKVLYTDGPTDGTPDDLKLIKGIGPKFEKDLTGKGIYYFRQIAAWKADDVKMVEGVIDSIPGRIKRDEWVKQAKGLAKTTTKKASSSAKGKPGPKPGMKRSELTASGKPRKKPGPKSNGKSAKLSEADAKFAKYLENVRKYDPKANEDVVRGIVKYCGIALRTRDGSLVACSDEAELQRVADGFVTKKLQKTSGQLDLVKEICQDMKAQRFKNRVTFYYLGAKKTRKLGIFK